MLSNSIEFLPLTSLLENNLIFHVIMEREVSETPFGTITFNFTIKGGIIVLSTLNIVKNRRRRYSGNKVDMD